MGHAKWINRLSWAGMLGLAVGCSVQVVRLAAAQAKAGPSTTPPGIARAAELEIQGQAGQAEKLLLGAAQADRRFAPAWALANFYHRQERPEAFRRWFRRAAEMSYGDRDALFHLAPDADSLPANLHAGYAAFLISANRLDEAARILPSGESGWDLVLAERLVNANRFPDAAAVWNRFRSPHLSADQPAIVNGDFRRSSSGLAFDWRLGTRDDVTVTIHPEPKLGFAEFHFTGRQPDTGELMSQHLIVAPDRCYRLSAENRGTAAGLRWTAEVPPHGANLLANGGDLPGAADWQPQSWIFKTGANTHRARLTLSWQRPTGPVAASATIAIRNVRLEPEP